MCMFLDWNTSTLLACCLMWCMKQHGLAGLQASFCVLVDPSFCFHLSLHTRAELLLVISPPSQTLASYCFCFKIHSIKYCVGSRWKGFLKNVYSSSGTIEVLLDIEKQAPPPHPPTLGWEHEIVCRSFKTPFWLKPRGQAGPLRNVRLPFPWKQPNPNTSIRLAERDWRGLVGLLPTAPSSSYRATLVVHHGSPVARKHCSALNKYHF